MKKLFISCIALCMAFAACEKSPGSGSSEEPEEPASVSLRADLFDLSVGSNAAGTDFSAHKCKVTTNSGFTLSSYYNDYYKRFAAVFGGTPGKSAGSGYYRVDYSSDEVLKAKLAEGFSMEALFCAGSLPTGTAEAAVFSSVQDAGFGIGVGSGSSGSHIRFTLYTDKLRTLDSGISAVPGYWYHVIAVWDKEQAKASLYVDGVLKASSATGENLSLPSDSNSAWFGIGADCSSALNYAEHLWQGEVAIARLWGRALESSEVQSLYGKVQRSNQVRSGINLTDVAFLSNCNVGKGYKYHVYASGVASLDVLALRSGSKELSCSTSYSSGHLTAAIPDGLTSGTWSLVLLRGSSEKVLGSVKFTVSANPALPEPMKVFAHRCVHNNTSGPYENSLEALIKTQTYGVYGAEFDVWITQDGKVVVNHDATVGGVNIEKSKWSQLKNIKLPTGEHLPLLEEFLDQGLKYPSVVLNFEIKKHSDVSRSTACAEAVAELLNARNMASQCRVMSYSTEALDRLRSKIPSLQLDYLGTADPSVPIGKGYNGISYNMNLLSANPDYISRCHAAGLKVCTWTPSTVADLLTFMNLGVDFVTVNNVDLAKTITGRTYISVN